MSMNIYKIISCLVFIHNFFHSVCGATDGLQWLQSNQNYSGSWGSEWQFADTCDVLHTLREVAPDSNSIQPGLEWLAYEYAPNLEFLSRQIIALAGVADYEVITDSLVDELLLSRNESTTTLIPNWPEGGWGLDIGYETDCMTTAMALLACDAVGLNAGLGTWDRVLTAGQFETYELDIPQDAINVKVLIETDASVYLSMKEGSPPTLDDPWATLNPGYWLFVFPDNGLPFTPGHNYITVESVDSALTYSMHVSYETPTWDTRMFWDPGNTLGQGYGPFEDAFNYLMEAQNGDGGWGLQRGVSTDLYTTVHVLQALQAYTHYENKPELAAGMTWLRSQQFGDGSFGYADIGEVIETALAASVLIKDDGYPFQTDTLNAISYLENTQQPNGSWNDEPYDTALAALSIDSLNQIPVADAGSDQWLIDTDTNLVESVTLDASASTDIDGSIISYVWTENGQTVATGINPTIEFRTGTHNLTLTVTDDGGKTAMDSVEIKITPQPQVFYSENMDTDPEWTTQGQWAWGQPIGQGGGYGDLDPVSGYTGSNVYGYNLAGPYTDNMSEMYLTTTIIDCSGYSDVQFSFYRWLNVQNSPWDNATVQVTTTPLDPGSWVTVYQNPTDAPGGWLYENAWSKHTYNISSIADNQAEVYIRWCMGSTDGMYAMAGWNIDDVEMTGAQGPPGSPSIPDLLAVDDSGVSDSDDITGVDNPRIDIYVSDPNLMFVEVYNDDVLLGQATQQSTYQWQYQLQAAQLSIGENQISAIAAGLGGFSEMSSPLLLNYKPHSLVSDFNNDGITNIIDLVSFSSAWLTSNSKYDISNPVDGIVNLPDFWGIAQQWQQTELWW